MRPPRMALLKTHGAKSQPRVLRLPSAQGSSGQPPGRRGESWNIPWGVAQCPCGQSVKRILLRISTLTLQPVMHTFRTRQRR